MDPMALVGGGDLISSVQILVGVEHLINYIIFCIFVDLVIVGDWKIPAVFAMLGSRLQVPPPASQHQQ